jgi:predicted outer membrane repeat protein
MRRAALGIGLLLALGAPARAALYLINPDGSGSFPTIQAAVSASLEGDIVLLTDGTFRGEGNRDIVFPGYRIILQSESGDPAACVIDCEGSAGSPHRAFFFPAGEWADAAVNSITIEGGHQTQGGACYLTGDASAIFTHVVFRDNSAGKGGALAVAGFAAPGLNNCTLEENSATTYGGALYLSDNGQVTVNGCLFLANIAPQGGAIYATGAAAPFISSTTFSGNSGAISGGALELDTSSFPTIFGSTFSANSAPTGGGLNLLGATNLPLILTLIVFGPTGSAIECGGGATAALTCCDVYGNAGGDWVDGIATQLGVDHNIARDPLFCSTTPDDSRLWTLHPNSPCTADSSGCANDIGAWGTGCPETPVERTTWGALKALYR